MDSPTPEDPISNDTPKLPQIDPDVEKQDRKSTLNFDFDGKAVVTFEGQQGLFSSILANTPEYERLMHLLNQNSSEISEAISSELRARLKGVGSDVDVAIEFKAGSLLFTGLITITDFLARLDGTVGGIKFIIDAAKFAVNRVVRTQIENNDQATVKRIHTTVVERKIREKDPINPFTRALWWCAGAVTDILRHCPEDKAKYQTVGTAVLTTGLLAFCSGGYALYTMFVGGAYAAGLAIAFGLIWGFIIFNIDRSIVSSMRKEDEDNSKWFRNLVFEARSASPRILLAVILGLVICKPLELRFFSNQIDTKVTENRSKRADGYAAQLREGKYKTQRDGATKGLTEAQSEVQRARDELDKYTKIFNSEMDASGGTKRYGYGPVATKKEGDKLTAHRELGRLESILETKKTNSAADIGSIESNIATERQEYASRITNNFSQQLEALWDLTAESRGLWWANIGIIMLLIMIELVPILVKLFSRIGPYDARLNQREKVAIEKARLSKESEFQVAAIKADSSIAEAQQQSDVHREELRLRGSAAIRVADHRYGRISASEISLIDMFFEITDRVREERMRDHVRTWEADGSGNAPSFDELLRAELRNIGVDLKV